MWDDLVVSFAQSEAGVVSLVGGKGRNLMALVAAGFPVPPGFVVTSSAYREFLDQADWLDAELASFDYDRPERLREQCDQVRLRLAQVELPEQVRDAVRAGLETIDAETVAVRSSSTFEDLAQAAFAGQHDTYLNIRGVTDVWAGVRNCFASLWGDRAVLYRHHQGFTQRDARMAVVVQRQVACDRAGVGFSINPVSGSIGRMVIDANFGLGESVVSGECEVDHFELDKKTLSVVERNIGHKEHMVVPAPKGVENRKIPADLADKPCLADEQVHAIGKLLRRVEAHYGWPQDIEWGWKDDSLFILQSRPVTTIQPRWTRDESAERFPNPMTPLSWDFISEAFRQSLSNSLSLMDLPSLEGDWFARFDNYIYGNQNAVELIGSIRPLRAASAQELAAEIPELRRRYAWVLDLPVSWARDLDRYLIRLGRLSAFALDDADAPAIWRHMNEVLEVATDYFRPNIAISMTQAFLYRLLHALVTMVVGPGRALEVVDGLMSGCETKTALVNRELHELSQVAARSPALRQVLVEESGADVWRRERMRAFPDFAARFGRFLEDHGHREMDMDYFHPTWSAAPWIVLDTIALVLRNEGGADPEVTARELRRRHAEAEHAFVAGLPEALRFFFKEMIRLTRTYTALDDLEHYQTTRINPLARRAAIVMGERLRERGILDAPEDVFFFSKQDLQELMLAFPNEEGGRFRLRADTAKRSYEAAKRQTPRWSLDEVAAAVDGGELLRGLPGSPGRITGVVFRVLDPADFARFPKGAILLARTTNPAWTPLFYSASGLITESGGPLSHGAVTAREMRLPAVMSVRGVMSRLDDGQVVTVDGTQGTIAIEAAKDA